MLVNVGGAPRQEKSLRNQVRIALLTLFAQGTHGTTNEVVATVRKRRWDKERRTRWEAGEKNLLIQIAQVRGKLLTSLGVKVPEVRGRMNQEMLDSIRHQLSLKRVQARIATLLQEEGIEVNKAA